MGRLAVTLGLGCVVAAVLGAVWGVLAADSVREGIPLGFYVAGVLALLLAAMGIGSPSRRDATAADWEQQWASRETFARNRDDRGDAGLGESVIFALTGLVLLGAGVLVEVAA